MAVIRRFRGFSDYVIARVGMCMYIHTYTFSLTDQSSAQDGTNVEFVMKRAKLQHAIKSNKLQITQN